MGEIRSVDVGKTLRLVPFWERGLVKTERTELIIDPGPSFGAGDHPTTIMALELLEQAVTGRAVRSNRPTMLDVGTGTGVLAIAGKALGTGLTVGLDIDSVAVYTARRNVGLNGLESRESESAHGVDLLVGGADCVSGCFSIVTVNLVAPVLLRLREQLTVKVGEALILSGIADVMAREVLTAFTAEGLSLVVHKSREGWNSALFHRSVL